AKATTEISEQIASIQAASDQTVTAIQNVANVIAEIDQIGTAIGAAIEEQGSATKEISRSVQEAARGTQEVNSNITGVQKAADDTGAAANQVLGAAEQLSSQSKDLAGQVNRFLWEGGAAGPACRIPPAGLANPLERSTRAARARGARSTGG